MIEEQGFKIRSKIGTTCMFSSTTVKKGDMVYTRPTKRLTEDEIEAIGCEFADMGGDIGGDNWGRFANAIMDKFMEVNK